MAAIRLERGAFLYLCGMLPALFASAAIMVMLGLFCARMLKPRAPSDARA